MRRWLRLPQKLSYRLVVLYVSLFVVVLGSVVATGLVIATRQIAGSVDDQLSGIADTVEQRLGDPASNQKVLDDLSTETQYLQLLDASGATTMRSRNLRLDRLPTFIRGGQPKGDGFHTSPFRKNELRILRRAILTDGKVSGYILVGVIIPNVGESTVDLGLILGGAAAAGLIAVVVGSIWVAHREATPLQRLAEDILATAESGFVTPIRPPSSTSQEARALHKAFSELVERQRQLIGRERAFFADSSHVLRTPLAVLQGDIEMLEQGVYGKERQEAVTQARAAIDTMSRTVSGLLLLARDDSSTASGWEIADLGELLDRLAADAKTAFPALSISCACAPGLDVAGNPDQLRELFLSLIENACRYTPAGGRVAVAARSEGRDLEVTVRDSGIGFSEEVGRRAPERFYRGPEARRMFPGGSGLGLAIAERIAVLHNGTLDIGKNEAEGALVTVRLPALG